MARLLALRAKILGGFDESRAEDHLPVAIDDDAGGQRVLAVHEPARQAQPIGRSILG